MRYRLVVLMLFVVLPMMNVLAAPAPEPAHAILDIGPPPKDMTAEEYCRDVIYRLTNPRGFIWYTASDPKVSKLPSVARLKDAPSWLVKNIRATPENGGRRLRLTFRAGTRAEQVAIINALLRGYLKQWPEDSIKHLEEALRSDEKCVVDLEERIASGQQPHMVDRYRKGINDLRSKRIPGTIAEIHRLKQVTVIKWAK
jgi:hypothetical protein